MSACQQQKPGEVWFNPWGRFRTATRPEVVAMWFRDTFGGVQ